MFCEEGQFADNAAASSMDRDRCVEYLDRGSPDHMSSMASVDSAHAFEEEIRLCHLL